MVGLTGDTVRSALLYLYKVSAGFRLMYSINIINKTIIIMVKQNLLTKLLLLFALIVGSTSVWADDIIESNFTDKDLTVGDNELKWTGTNISQFEKSGDARGVQSNKNTTAMVFTSNATQTEVLGTIKKIVVTASANAERSISVTVGGNNFGTTQSVAKGSKNADFTFEGNASGTIVISFNAGSSSSSCWIKKIVVTYAANITDNRTNPELVYTVTSQTINIGETLTAPALTNPYDLSVTYSSDKTSVATVDANGNVTGVAAGTATITASFDGNDEYKPGSASYTIIVNREELAYNVKETISNLGYDFWSEITSSGSSADEINGSQNGIDIKIEKATGTAPRADGNYVRFYKNCIMTISAPTGSYFTKIVFKEPLSGNEWKGTMDPDKGDYDNTEKTWYASETGVTKLVLTGVTGTNRIGGMEIYLMVSPLSITPAKQYVSFCSPYALDFTDTGLTAYVVSAETETSVSLTAVNRVPANTGLVLKGTANTNYTVPVLSGEADTFENKLEATGTEGVTVDANSVYVLSDGQFKLYTGTTIVGGKAYLPTTSGAPALSLNFDEGTTGINLTSVNGLQTTDNVYFDLSGRRIAQPTKGLYIVNGKKVIIK